MTYGIEPTAIMLTGANAHDAHVKDALGLSRKDEIIGFLYFGTPSVPPRAIAPGSLPISTLIRFSACTT